LSYQFICLLVLSSVYSHDRQARSGSVGYSHDDQSDVMWPLRFIFI